MYKRKVYDTIIKRLEERRMFIQVIMGPRQIGKSTVIRQVLDDLDKPSLFYSADTIPSTSSTWISECWANARLQMRAQGQEEMILVIDEIQKLKNWSEYVKKEWDTDSLSRINLKVALLSPSRVLLEKGLAESLMGRYEEVRMSHWSYPEMQEAFGFTLELYIYYGGYPGAVSLISNDEVDFILKKNQKIIAVEVKNNAESHTTGLERFHRLFNPLATIIVGEKGIKPEVFLSMDLQKLFE